MINHPLYSVLKNYGLAVNDKAVLKSAADTISRMMDSPMELVFALSPEELERAKIYWSWDCLMKDIAKHGFAEGELEAL
jgi:hypothetical protein